MMEQTQLPAFADASIRSLQNETTQTQSPGQTMRFNLARSGFLVGGILVLAFNFAAAPGAAPTLGAFANALAVSRIRLGSAGTTDYFRLSGFSAAMLSATREGMLCRGDIAATYEATVATRYAYLNQGSATQFFVAFNLRNILGELDLLSLLDTEGTGGLNLEVDLAPAAGTHPMTGYTSCTGYLTTERRLYPLTPVEPPFQGLVKTVIEVSQPLGPAVTQDNFAMPQIGMVGGAWVYYTNAVTNALQPTELADYTIQFGSISNPYREGGRQKLWREQAEEKFLLPSGVHRFDFLAATGDSEVSPHTRDCIKVVDATDVRLQLNFDPAFSTFAANNTRVILQEIYSPAVAS